MVPGLPHTALQRLLTTISPLLDVSPPHPLPHCLLTSPPPHCFLPSPHILSCQSVDSTLQKKGYKVLQELLSSEDHTHKGFILDQLKTLTSTLTDSLSTSATASKKVRVCHTLPFPCTCLSNSLQPRLQCLTCLLEHIGETTSYFLAMITPEVGHMTVTWTIG